MLLFFLPGLLPGYRSEVVALESPWHSIDACAAFGIASAWAIDY
jgi:hypothetical protein